MRNRNTRNRNFQRQQKEEKYAVNEKIKAREVRLVGENVPIGVYSISEALKIADDLGLDLVEISPNADPPVVKALDYAKFLYEQKKREKEMKSKATKVVVKEVRFGPNTDDHDYDFKKKHAQKFLEEGAKLKAYVFFKGRSIVFKDKGEILLLRLAQDLEDFGKVEQLPKLEGKRMIMLMAPKKEK
ncbi:MAG: translation initiation factor IF-3 [Flavobacteriaceae bacterium]|nr:translation initiation factor IF-3 [Flavobacteriaceae bacterium]